MSCLAAAEKDLREVQDSPNEAGQTDEGLRFRPTLDGPQEVVKALKGLLTDHIATAGEYSDSESTMGFRFKWGFLSRLFPRARESLERWAGHATNLRPLGKGVPLRSPPSG